MIERFNPFRIVHNVREYIRRERMRYREQNKAFSKNLQELDNLLDELRSLGEAYEERFMKPRISTVDPRNNGKTK